jgi:hypothetical protein
MADGFWSAGYAVYDNFADRRACDALVDAVNDYRHHHRLPYIERRCRGRDLRYQVIDGPRVAEALPAVDGLLQAADRAVSEACCRPLARLAGQVGVNVNITPPGGSYRWHYDRCPVTAMVYLNAVAGGEIELYPNHRLPCGHFAGTSLQRTVDAVGACRPVLWLSRAPHVAVSPVPGRLLIIRGDRCLHSVREVGEGPDRINLVVSYDVVGAERARPELDAYLYSDAPFGGPDPNYGHPKRSRATHR